MTGNIVASVKTSIQSGVDSCWNSFLLDADKKLSNSFIRNDITPHIVDTSIMGLCTSLKTKNTRRIFQVGD